MKHILLSLTVALIAGSMQPVLAQGIVSDSTASVTTGNSKKELDGVVVSASNHRMRQHVESTQMGRVDLPAAMLLKVPAIAGEPDIIKALQLTPGVKRGTEGAIGMYVRGGNNDENLILLDGATVYNAGHLLGFFSVFNAGSVKDVQLYKSSFPAQYGGRLSSVLDVQTKQGSLSEYKATGSIGLISSSATISGPIIKDKLSLSVSGRRTYIDKVFTYIPYHFYDVNGKLTYVIDGRNRIYVSGYKGDDVLRMKTDSKDSATGVVQEFNTGMKLGNTTGSVRWNHAARSGKYASDVSVLYTKFGYSINGSLGDNSILIKSAIRDVALKADVRSTNTGDHKLQGGFSLTNHYFNPNIVSSEGPMLDDFESRGGQQIYNNEAALYINDDYKLSEQWQLAGGVRLSGDFMKGSSYINAEPRLAARYLINERSSVKASYARMAQYMHLVSSSSMAMPTDLWYPVTANVKPGVSDQISAGYYYTIPSLNVSLSVEAYYKWLHNLVEYREGALLILNDNYEKELVHGKGRSYGVELFASKTSGRFTGWMGYSLSYARRTFDSLNKGEEYDARYDRRHDFSLVGMYDLNQRWSLSSTMVYSTGSPFTGQTSQYAVPNPSFTGIETLPVYTSRNALRMSAAFRVDLDLGYKFQLSRRIKGDAHISIYNVMNRTQPSKVVRVWNEEKGAFGYQQKGLFGTITSGSINFNL